MTISKKPVDNALNPAWRDAAIHLITTQTWDDSLAKAQVKQILDDMTYSKLNALRELDPGSGAYLNEVCRHNVSLMFACWINFAKDSRQIPSSPVGNGPSLGQTTPDSDRSRINMIRMARSGVLSASAARTGRNKRMERSAACINHSELSHRNPAEIWWCDEW